MNMDGDGGNVHSRHLLRAIRSDANPLGSFLPRPPLPVHIFGVK